MTSKTPAAPILGTAPSESLYGLLFQNSLDGLMLTAPDGSILDANPAACRVMRRTREEILHEGRPGLIDASDPSLAALIADRQPTGRAYGELRARRKDDSLFPIELSSVVFQSPDGDSKRALSFATSLSAGPPKPNASA
jgi:PAS domain S-box-containing protein